MPANYGAMLELGREFREFDVAEEVDVLLSFASGGPVPQSKYALQPLLLYFSRDCGRQQA
jgi:hypothetical protein